MLKLLKWLPAIVAPLLGILEAVVKFLKELLTLVVTILFPIIPSAKFKAIVNAVRTVVNKIYEWLSRYKESILKYLGMI